MNWAAWAPVTEAVTGMVTAAVLVTVTTWGTAVVVAGSCASKPTELGLALRPGASWPTTANCLVLKVAPPPDTVTEFTPRGLPTTAWGVMPSPMKPVGAAGATAGSHLRNGPTDPPRALPKAPGTPGIFVRMVRARPAASVVNEVGGS